MSPTSSPTSSPTASIDSGRRRGPKPILSMELENQLAEWIVMQQRAWVRVSRDDVITHAKELLQKNETQENATKKLHRLGVGWCNCFMARHMEITLRSQSLSVITKKAPIKTRKFNWKHMDAAVEMCLDGKPMGQIMERFPLLHPRTIQRRVSRTKRGEGNRRRGPRPLLEEKAEQKLVAWILSMRSRGIKVMQRTILARANEQYRALNGGEDGENKLKVGWLRRFKERYPVLLSGHQPICVYDEDDDYSSTEEDKCSSSSGGDELMQSKRNVEPSPEGREKGGPQLKRVDVVGGRTEDTAAGPKRPEIEDTALITTGESARQGSIMPQQRQSGTVGNAEKFDAVMQSNERLEQMQLQQLEMLLQLCPSTLPKPVSH